MHCSKLHRKLTSEHIYPDTQMKMRNHLAEQVLNKDMLYLMKQYQQHLGAKGDCLNGCIEFLEKTSEMIENFRNHREIKCLEDPQLNRILFIAQ